MTCWRAVGRRRQIKDPATDPGCVTAMPRPAIIDLNRWHHAIHAVTGDMAVRFNRATVDDLKRWARMLRAVADEMDAPEAGR